MGTAMPPLAQPTATTSDTTLSPNQRIGFVTWVSDTDNTLVIELDPYLAVPPLSLPAKYPPATKS
tara:strand:- start:449 stop:643 length:195 start_codon:yes stop_codon:yes gene_type:complete